MMRILLVAIAVSVFCKWALGKWPWDYLRPAPTRQQAVFKARSLLNVEASATHKDIRDAHRRMEAGNVAPVVHAAAIAFGFVFVHPFEDANGRIHRFLIHNILARSRFTPPDLGAYSMVVSTNRGRGSSAACLVALRVSETSSSQPGIRRSSPS